MKELTQFLPLAELLVKKLTEEIDQEIIDLKTAERKILEFIHKIGHVMFETVVEKIQEPTVENRVEIDGKIARYRDMQNRRIRNRFGGVIVRPRRSYKVDGVVGGYYPLDEKLGLDRCAGFSPLMSYLLSFFGGCDAYEPAARQLSETLGFGVSSTAVQRNTEKTGTEMESHPFRVIPQEKEHQKSELFVVEIDGTMSPQIHEEEGITGREGLKQPTEYKECNVIAIEKRGSDGTIERWTGARYGPRKEFDRYVHFTGLKMGQLQAKEVVFLSDGARTNWDIQQNNFPEATVILDFYHATEHLALFCSFYKQNYLSGGRQDYQKWRQMIYDGEILQVIEELKLVLRRKVTNADEAQKHINYLTSNKERMQYEEYRARGYPIGSGLVEGRCKLVVCRRFKGNGMRWKKADNEAVLKVRLAILNGILERTFTPKPREFKLVSGEI